MAPEKTSESRVRYQPRRINFTDRPWAVIDSQGPFGDEIATGWIRTEDKANRLAIMYETAIWKRGMEAIEQAMSEPELRKFMENERR